MLLPADLDARAFDTLHDDPAAWRSAVVALAQTLGADANAVQQEAEGTVLVARLGRERVLKLYPPFLRDHFEFEHAMLERLHGRLSVPTPQLLTSGECESWPYLLMTQLAGEPLTATWPAMSERERCRLLAALGALTAEVHALPVGLIASLAPPWLHFVAQQRERCMARQQRNGLPPHLLAALPGFIAGPVPEGPAVLLTGEYTPMNLFTSGTRGARLAAMFDFGDGLIGPREYDWLGPLCFLAAGQAPRVAAFMGGVGVRLDEALRTTLLRLLLLHRYSNLPAQLACEGWQQTAGFEALAAQVWPLA